MESTSRTSPAGVFWSSALPRRWHTTICSPPLGRLVRSPGLMELETCSSRSNRARSAAAPYEHAPAAETSAEERTWQGRVWGYVPYDFRPPTLAPIRNSFWAPEPTRVLHSSGIRRRMGCQFRPRLRDLE